MKHIFTVWIDGCYYYDDEEYDVEIDLTDKVQAVGLAPLGQPSDNEYALLP